MENFDVFRFCMCRNTDVDKIENVETKSTYEATKDKGKDLTKDKNRSATITNSDVKVRFADSEDGQSSLDSNSTENEKFDREKVCSKDVQKSNITRPKAVSFEDTLHHEVSTLLANGYGNNEKKKTSKDPEFEALHTLVRNKRIYLRKQHAKLKIDLNSLQTMREILDSSKCANSANLPDVVSTEGNYRYSENDFLGTFRQIFNGAINDISAPSTELQELTVKYTKLLSQSASGKDISDEDDPSQVEGESERLVHDSQRIIEMLKKGMEIATIQHKLKSALVSQSASHKEDMSILESVLLQMQRFKLKQGLTFEDSQSQFSSHKDGTACTSIRDIFRELFDSGKLLKLEKKCKLKLAELHIEALENKYREDEVRNQLKKAIEHRSEEELIAAINESKEVAISTSNELQIQAENLLSELTDEVRRCENAITNAIEHSSIKDLQKALKKAENLKMKNSASLIERAKLALGKLEEREDKIKELVSQLKQAMKKKNAEEIQKTLVNIKSMKVTTGMKIIEEATNLLIYLRKYDQELKTGAEETTRIRLISLLESDNTQDLADVLLRARMVGLNNCVEVIGARTKLAQLQGDRDQYSTELKKIEEYVEKLINRAGDNSATVDLITTMERAIVVAENLEVSSEIKQRARGALHILNSRKAKVKSIKDELQRAVMECRQEAITCAIKEAESIPYFLSFDPLDGQISAILEYAKNKIASHDAPSMKNETNSAVRRVKSNLKRAMRGNNSDKLQSAISLYRKTVPTQKHANTDKQTNSPYSENDNDVIIRRAERKYKRMKKQEELAEKEWINVRNKMRENLKSAMRGTDRAELWKAVYQFKRELGSSLDKQDETLLLSARKQLREVTIKQFKTNLNSALQDRNSTRLQHSLIELDSPSLTMFPMNMDKTFKDDISKARKLLDHLKEMEKLRKSVSDMSRSQLAEIHRYPNPPECVRAVMTATYVLLGEKEKDLKEWNDVLRLMVKMGRESLTRRVAICSSTHVPTATALRVEELLSRFTLTQVQDINKGAANFYAWAKCMTKEILERHKDDPPKQIVSKQARVPEKPKEPVTSDFWIRLSRPRSSVPTRSVRSARVNPRPTSALR
ncbi:uncharacterized protein LOC120347127 isoform X2 [Styela clava]